MGVNGSKDTADLVNTAAELRRKALPERARRGESGPGPGGADPSFFNSVLGGDPIAEERLEVFWTVPSDATHVFSLIQPDDVRRLRRLQPRNLARFLRVIVSKMKSLANQDQLHSNEQTYGLNCVRILTRVLPVLFENPNDDFIEKVWWENCLPVPRFDDEQYRREMAELEEKFRASLLRGRETEEEKQAARQNRQQQPSEGNAEVDVSSDEDTDEDENDEGTHGAPPLPPHVPCDWQWEPFSKAAAREYYTNLIKEKRANANSTERKQNRSSTESKDESVRVRSSRVTVSANLGDDAPAVRHDPTFEDEPLGRVMVHSVMRLLFCPDFTVERGVWNMFKNKLEEEELRAKNDSNANGSADNGNAEDDSAPVEAGYAADNEQQRTLANAVWPSILWAGGVGFSKASPPKSSTYDANRVEVLRLLEAVMSQPLYQEADPENPCRSKFIDAAVSPDCPFAPTLFYSLLNAALVYDPVGWGLPYGAAIMADTAEGLMDMSLQVLLLLLDYAALLTKEEARAWALTNRDEDGQGVDSDETEEELPVYTVPNTYRALLAGLQDEDDFRFMFDRVSNLLANVHRSDSSMLPYSVKQISCHQELLVLLWKLLDDNDDFLSWVLKIGFSDVCKIATPMLYYMWTGRSNPAKVGLIHLCTFILLLLSGHRNFAVALNKPFNERLPTDLPLFDGNHADLLVIVLHKLIVNASDKLSTIYSCFLTIIANISPYVKSFSLVASVKLLNLVELFADPVFVLSHPNHHTYVEQLLDTMNNIIQYQYEGNGHVIYGILRLSKVFENLSMLPRFLPKVQSIIRQKAKKVEYVSRPNRNISDDHAQASANAAGAALSGPPGSAAADDDKVEESTPSDKPEEGGVDAFPTKVTSAHRSGVVPGTESTLPQNNEPTRTNNRRGGDAPGVSQAGGNQEEQELGAPPLPSGAFWPTREWLQEWYPNMLSQLGTPLRLLQHLSPQVEEFIEESEGTADEHAVLDFIRNTTLVGLLPVPHAVVMRRYQPNKYTALWFTTFLWGVIFLRNQEYPVFDSRQIKLFSITLV